MAEKMQPVPPSVIFDAMADKAGVNDLSVAIANLTTKGGIDPIRRGWADARFGFLDEALSSLSVSPLTWEQKVQEGRAMARTVALSR